jgi:hypothetical protein
MPRYGAAEHFGSVADPILAAAEFAAGAVAKARRSRRRPRGGAILRPGSGTPLWNKLAADVANSVRRRGEKVKLARILGISRQRLHLLLVAKSACPDAERTLLLQQWLIARRRGEDLG